MSDVLEVDKPIAPISPPPAPEELRLLLFFDGVVVDILDVGGNPDTGFKEKAKAAAASSSVFSSMDKDEVLLLLLLDEFAAYC